jgi:hypothetical protein
MRRSSITSVLLIVVLAASASACVAGSGNPSLAACSRNPGITARTKAAKTVAVRSTCGHDLRSLPGRCGMRTFVQLHSVALQTAEIVSPLARPAGRISVLFDSVILVSSIGSPETDRGPPNS